LGIERDPSGEAARYARITLVGCDSVDFGLPLGALGKPARAGAWRVEINQRRCEAADGEIAGEIDRDRGFARTTLRVEENDLLHAGRTIRFDSGSLRSGTNRCKRRSTVTNEHCPRQCVCAELSRNELNHSTALKAKVHIAL